MAEPRAYFFKNLASGAGDNFWLGITHRPAGLGIRSFDFRANRSFFVKKWGNKRFAQKNERFTHLLIYGEQPERFAHNRSFLVSDLRELLTIPHFWWATSANRSWWLIFGERPKRFAHMAQREWATMRDSLRSLTKNEQITFLSKSLIWSLFAIHSENRWANSQPWCASYSGVKCRSVHHIDSGKC